MGKTGKWIRSFLTGKKEKDKDRDKDKENSSSFTDENLATPIGVPPTTPKEKRRWSFRRSSAMGVSARDTNSMNLMAATPPVVVQAPKLETENGQKQQAMAVEAATTAADAVIKLTDSATRTPITVKDAAAIKIQAVFRSHLARKALRALKGLVKLQALVRGYLVRKQANTTLRCMQALLTVQARAVAHRIQVAEGSQVNSRKRSINRKSPQENWFRQVYKDMERGVEENIKIVEMDICELRGSLKTMNAYSSHPQIERAEHRMSPYSAHHHSHSKPEHHQQISPVPSALTDMSPRAFSGHFEEHIYSTEQSNPHYYSAGSKSNSTKAPYKYSQTDDADSVSQDYPFFPNYMANTESSKAKVRSHSAPKQRPDTCERQPSRRRTSMEGRNVPRGVQMQRSSSHVGSAAHGYHYPCSIKLDKSMVSLKDSECGSTSTVLTNNNYYRSLVAYEPYGYIY